MTKEGWIYRPGAAIASEEKFWKRMEKKLRKNPRKIFERWGLDYWISSIVDEAGYINEKDLRKILTFCYRQALKKLARDQEIRRSGYGIYRVTAYQQAMELI